MIVREDSLVVYILTIRSKEYTINPMNGLEMRGPCFGCDVFDSGNTRVKSIYKEGDTCDVTLVDGTPATLCSEGPRQGFYIQFPVQGLNVQRIYPYAQIGNPFLKLANGNRARAT